MCYDLVCFKLACTCTTCRKKHFRSTLLTVTEHLRSPPPFCGICVVQSIVFCGGVLQVNVCRFVLFFFVTVLYVVCIVCRLYCLSFVFSVVCIVRRLYCLLFVLSAVCILQSEIRPIIIMSSIKGHTH
jgi:hypothetical protein